MNFGLVNGKNYQIGLSCGGGVRSLRLVADENLADGEVVDDSSRILAGSRGSFLAEKDRQSVLFGKEVAKFYEVSTVYV